LKFINLGIILTLIAFGSLVTFFNLQEIRLANYCDSLEPGKTFIEARLEAEAAFHAFRLNNGSELVVEPRGPRLAPIRCRVFFNRFRTVATAFFEEY